MKLRTDPGQLADAVGWVAKNLSPRPTVPVVGGVLLRADGDRLHVCGFDYETATHATIETEPGLDTGVTLVSGRLLAEITKSLPKKPVEMYTVGAALELVCGSSRFTLPTMPAEDYPTLPDQPETAGTVDASTFATAVHQVVVAAGADQTLPLLTGVRIECRGATMSMLATDRYRLAHVDIPWNPVDPDHDYSPLVPAKVLADVAKHVGHTLDAITIGLSRQLHGEGVIGFATGARRATSRLLDGHNYPPVRTLFPTDDQIKAAARVPAAPLIEVVKRVALVAERATPVLLSFDPDGGLVVEAGGVEEARASDTTDATYQGPPMTVAFNPHYLIDGLATLGAPTAVFGLVDPNKPALLQPAQGDEDAPDDKHRYLIVPIRVTR